MYLVLSALDWYTNIFLCRSHVNSRYLFGFQVLPSKEFQPDSSVAKPVERNASMDSGTVPSTFCICAGMF